MLELEVAFGYEAEMIWTDILEGADPAILLRKSTDDLVFGDPQVSLLEREEVACDSVDLEVLLIFELLEVGFGDLDAFWERLRKGQSIFAVVSV